MIPSVIARQLQTGVEDFLKTTFPVSTPHFHHLLDDFLAQKDAVFKGPYLSVGLPFRRGESGADFFPDIPMEWPPHAHQETAFRRMSGDSPRSTLVATGTGSGKTECFLLPILDHCRRARENGSGPGVKAIFIYPMNALAADQAGRLARLIHETPALRSRVTAGIYVGQRERHPRATLGPDHLVTDRKILRAQPPDILLTNYKMLDYLLIRPEDRGLWEKNGPDTLRFLVVDEIHTFDGAQGTDLACLIRRLKGRLETPEGRLCCVGTSATLGGEGDAAALRNYAEAVFGETFDAESVVGERRLGLAEFLADGSVDGPVDVPVANGADSTARFPADPSRLNPDDFSDVPAFLWALFAAWFDGPAPDFSDFALDTDDEDEKARINRERAKLGERLRGHFFLRTLLTVLEKTPLIPHDALRDRLAALDGDFAALSPDERDLILNGFLALLSESRHALGGGPPAPLQVRTQIWMRELRRMVCSVGPEKPGESRRSRGPKTSKAESHRPPDSSEEKSDDGVPRLAYATDLSTEAAKRHLPVVHCRECGVMGWAGVQKPADRRVQSDLTAFYLAFFQRRTDVAFFFPEEPDAPPPDPRTGATFRLCGHCLFLSDRPEPDGACPACGETGPVRVFKPFIGTRKVKNREVAKRECPFCMAAGGLTIVGSRAASLTSVLISQLFAAPFNRDSDRRLLAFSDAVQDAAHRAGFFEARTYRFNFRGAVQQVVDSGGEGATLAELPERFIGHWTGRKSRADFIATFLPPDMAWLADYETLRNSGALPTDSRLLPDLHQRIAWEIVAEYGYRARIGRTLEQTGASVAGPDPARFSAAVDDLREALRNEVGMLESLDRRTTEVFLAGFLGHLRTAGGILHPALEDYAKQGGNIFALRKDRLWLPRIGDQSAPAFLTTGRAARFDRLWSRTRTTWYADWCERCFLPVCPLPGEIAPSAMEVLTDALVRTGVLGEGRAGSDRVWGIRPEALRVTASVRRFSCETCRHRVSVSAAEADLWDGAPCLRFRCGGRYAPAQTGDDYYAQLYKEGRVARIFAAEHTGLLDRETRESLEARFKTGKPRPGDPNLLSCTPTLEMGVDIGDLSSVLLCSVPPGGAGYLQRIGRAGRRDGNALNVTVANGQPHDLFFYADPPAMMAGAVRPPGVFLDASAVLERQFTGYCMDRWAAEGAAPTAVPARMKPVFAALNRPDDQKFPFNFIAFVESRREGLLKGFLALFAGRLSDASVAHIRDFARHGRDAEEGLAWRLLNGLHEQFREREDLRRRLNRLTDRIRQTEAQTVRDRNWEDELAEMRRERDGLAELIRRMNDRATLNFLTDEGLLPNYAFPEAGVTLRSIIYRRRKKSEDGKGKFETTALEYERAGVAAIRELAPGSPFYAEGRKVTVDQVNLALSPPISWRFCPRCPFMAQTGTAQAEAAACPRCGSPLFADGGQVRTLVRLTSVFAATPDRESRIVDDSDQREPTFYNTELMAAARPETVRMGWRIDTDVLPLAFDFLSRVDFREINFGRRETEGEMVTIAGRESPRKGFLICAHCGKVQGLDGNNPPRHSFQCRSRNKSRRPDLTECVYLYREFSSEAIRMLLPFGGDEKKRHSFIAALHLGLKQRFGGGVDHLQTAFQTEPVPDSDRTRDYLYLFDTVPGGTGYLKQLTRSEAPLMDALDAALRTIRACQCDNVPDADGCYRCVFAYRRRFAMAETSRAAAIELLADIHKHRDKLTPVASLEAVRSNALFDSPLEERFIQALSAHAGDPGMVKETVNGKPGYFLRIGAHAYTVEPQPELGASDGLEFPCRPDFLIRPARSGANGALPAAVFTDGFQVHRDRIAEDLRQRDAIRRTGRFRIWSLTWNDVERAISPSAVTHWTELPESAVSSKAFNQFLGGLKLDSWNGRQRADSFALLMAYLSEPDETQWQRFVLAHAISRLVHASANPQPSAANWVADLAEWLPGFEENPPQADLFAALPPDGPGVLLRLFLAAGSAGVQTLDPTKTTLVLALSDRPEDRATPHFQPAWNGFLNRCNFYQFLPHAHFRLRSTPVHARPFRSVRVPAAAPPPNHPWREAHDLAPAAAPLLAALAAEDWPPPEPGFQFLENGVVRAEAELAWPDARLAVLTAGQMDFAQPFQAAGWRVVPLADAQTDPAAWARENRPEAAVT